MSFIKDLESFASKFEGEIEKLWQKDPSLDTVALTTLTFVGPILETVVSIEAGSATGALVTAVINEAEQDLIAAKAVLNTVGTTLSLKGLLEGVATNLGTLLTSAKVTNPTSVSNVKLVVGELTALTNAFPVAATPATTAA